MTDQLRYARQTILPEIGPEGQARLAAAHVLLVGCGALGCASADLLCRAGVGRLTIVDRDVVEFSNLQRQSLYSEEDARRCEPKAAAAQRRLSSVNSSIDISAVVEDLHHGNAEAIFGSAIEAAPLSAIIDGADNLSTRYLLNDIAVKLGVPLVYGGAVGVRGMASLLGAGGPCLRCIFPDPPRDGTIDTCDTAGILGPAAALVGAAQSAIVLRWIVSGQAGFGKRNLIEIDAWNGTSRCIALPSSPDPGCPCCARRDFAWLNGEESSPVTVLCTRTDGGSVQIRSMARSPEQMDALAERLARVSSIQRTPVFIRVEIPDQSPDFNGPVSLMVFADGRLVIKGSADTAFARSSHARYIGC